MFCECFTGPEEAMDTGASTAAATAGGLAPGAPLMEGDAEIKEEKPDITGQWSGLVINC